MLLSRRPLRVLLALRAASPASSSSSPAPPPPPSGFGHGIASKLADDALKLNRPKFMVPPRSSVLSKAELDAKEGITPNQLAHGNISGTRMLLNCTLKHTFIVSQRHFASESKDEDDDVEARLMRDDDSGEGFMNGPSYSMNDMNFEDYQEELPFDGSSEAPWKRPVDGMQARDGDGDLSDEDSGDDLNEPSDEEFEGGEKTDEELDELLANTPLFDPPEFEEPGAPEQDFSFRPEGPVYYPGMEYDPEELDITRPLPPRRREPREKEAFAVQDVIDKADFRNVRFLTRFITETGTIIARKEFKMRTKSHNRITKAIKTARFFGLMPYTNMGRPKYVFNEPFDEMSGFYETDEEEAKLAGNEGFEGRFRGNNNRDGRFIRRFPQRPGGFSGSGFGRR